MKGKLAALAAFAVVAAIVLAAVFTLRGGDKTAHVPTVAIYNLVSHPILDTSIKGIKAELATRGYRADRVRFVEINANGQMELLNAYAQEILAAHPDVVIPVSTPVTQAVAKAASPEQAIVFSTVTNPDDVGMAAHPSNMTGVSDAVNYEANLDLIVQLFPQARRLGIIYNAGERNSQFGLARVRGLAPQRHLTVSVVSISASAEVADAARSLAGQVDVFYVGSDNTVVTALDALLSVANERRLPVIASDVGSVEKGALAAVSVNYERVGREAGRMAADVLDTKAPPGRIPNVFVQGDALILNTAAASKIGFDFPPGVRARAVRTIP